MEGLELNPKFWRSKRVFLTGHTGFKGSWLSLWLQEMGANVVGYALVPPTNPSLFEVASVGEGMQSIIADIRDLPTLTAAIAKSRPEIVFHMAAQPLVRLSYEQPVETYATNVMGTVHMLEAIRQAGGVRAVVNITTDKCYENREWIWGYRENEPMGGYDPYSNSKGCAELVTAAYRESFFNPTDYAKHGVALASARAGNVIGGGDWATDRLIPDIIAAFLENRPAVIRNPQAIRPWQHVLEPLRGYLTLAEHLWNEGPAFAEAWNFGPNDEDAKPVEWIVKRLASTWGNGATWFIDGGNQPHEASCLKLDISKARRKLDWHPRWNLETSLQHIFDWYLTFQHGGNMRVFTLSQIAQYEFQTSPN
ncbi:MAG: CDP-glucose 4,6-dehydratase [Sterolibacterium sp.]